MKKWLAILGTSTLSVVAITAWWAKRKGKLKVDENSKTEEENISQSDIAWG